MSVSVFDLYSYGRKLFSSYLTSRLTYSHPPKPVHFGSPFSFLTRPPICSTSCSPPYSTIFPKRISSIAFKSASHGIAPSSIFWRKANTKLTMIPTPPPTWNPANCRSISITVHKAARQLYQKLWLFLTTNFRIGLSTWQSGRTLFYQDQCTWQWDPSTFPKFYIFWNPLAPSSGPWNFACHLWMITVIIRPVEASNTQCILWMSFKAFLIFEDCSSP